VIYRGRRTGGPGPDFRDAVIATREELLQGDVELHVRSSDFRRHGHQRDRAYDGVVLHLVFQHDEDSDTELASGRRVPVVALADWVDGRAAQILAWLQRPALWREPCFTAVTRIGKSGAGTALDRLGDIRFRQKSAAAAHALRAMPYADGEDVDGCLWTGVLEALGYGGQRELMSAVAAGAPWRTLVEAMSASAAATRRRVALGLLLEALAAARIRLPLLLPARPGNGPQARLRGAAALAARFAPSGIRGALQPLVEEAARGRPSGLLGALQVPGSIGRPRAVEIATNSVLPVLAALGDADAAEAAYRSLPVPARYGAVKHIHAALGGAVRLSARRQQGMLYLLREYCTRGGCGRCPLS
jgi:hypothetical protein